MDLEYQFWHWVFFFAVVLIALYVDIGIVNRKAHAPSRKETISWSVVWVSMALLFGVFVLWQFGSFKAKEFYTGYLIELSLSIDNLFVFLLIFSFSTCSPEGQPPRLVVNSSRNTFPNDQMSLLKSRGLLLMISGWQCRRSFSIVPGS